jgi:hypothetical protein
MKTLFLLSLLFFPLNNFAEEIKDCSCKCVTKSTDGEYSNVEGKGKDREEAGEKLKKNLGKKKCELSPSCEGTCSLDAK